MPPPNPPPPPPRPTRGNPLPTALQPVNVQLAEIANRLADLGKKSKDANDPLEKTVSLLDQFKKGLVDGAVQLRQLGQLARAPFEGLDTLVSAVNSTITRYVAAISPAAVRLWEITVANLNATIGDVLLPTLQSFQAVVKSISQGIASLDPPAKALIAVLAGAAVGFAVTAVAVAAVSAALNTLTAGIPAVLGAIAGGLAGAFVAMKDAKGVKETFDKVTRALADVGNALGRLFEPFARNLLPVLDRLLVQVAEDTRVWADALKDLAPLLKDLANLDVLPFLVRSPGAGILKALGFGGGEKPLGKEATAAQRVTTSGIDAYLQRLREAGLSSGTAAKKDPGEQLQTTNSLLTKVESHLDHIGKWLDSHGVPDALREGASEARDFIQRRAEGAENNPMAGFLTRIIAHQIIGAGR